MADGESKTKLIQIRKCVRDKIYRGGIFGNPQENDSEAG